MEAVIGQAVPCPRMGSGRTQWGVCCHTGHLKVAHEPLRSGAQPTLVTRLHCHRASEGLSQDLKETPYNQGVESEARR